MIFIFMIFLLNYIIKAIDLKKNANLDIMYLSKIRIYTVLIEHKTYNTLIENCFYNKLLQGGAL